MWLLILGNLPKQVTLSGLLNFVDGLWSTSGEERIIIFTTNYKERLDPALLRPGRMDMHIHMGYCCPESFRILASNYHSITDHDTYPEIEALIKEAMVTPAEVAEVLMRNDDTDIALQGLIRFLKGKKGDAKNSQGENVEHVTKEEEKEMMPTKKDDPVDQNLNDAGKQWCQSSVHIKCCSARITCWKCIVLVLIRGLFFRAAEYSGIMILCLLHIKSYVSHCM